MRLPRHKWLISWSGIEDPSGSSRTKLAWTPSGKDSSKKFYWDLDGNKVPNWECLFVHRKQGLFLSVDVDDIKNGWKEAQYGSHMEAIGEQCVGLDEPTSFLDHVFLGCTQRECKPNEIIIEYRTCSNHECLLAQLKNYQGGKNLTQRRSRGP